MEPAADLPSRSGADRAEDPAAAPRLSAVSFEIGCHHIIHAAREAIVTIDEQHRIVMINPAAQSMFGCTAGECLGDDLSRFIPRRFHDAHARHVREFDAGGAAERSMSERRPVIGRRANGEEFPAEAAISRLDVVGEFGPRRLFTALMRDITAEQSLIAEVEALNRRMRAVFDLAPVAIWITEGEQIVFANRACASLFGAGEGVPLVGQSIYALLSPESHAAVKQRVEEALAGKRSVTVHKDRITRLDGSVREVELAVAALPDHGHTAVQMVISDITERLHEKAEMERSRGELRRLSASLVDAREEERRRIARELHDELGQGLTALKMELVSLGSPASREAQHDRIAAMSDMIDDTVESVRRIAADLRPMMLDDLGLNAALEWLATGWSRRMGIAIQLRLEQEDPPIDNHMAIALFRMVQEALTNVARHARASEVQISLRSEADELLLTVQDNGVGLSDASDYPEDSHGLMGMRERVYMLGGSLEVGNGPSGGARITVHLPLQPSSIDAPAQTPRSSAAGSLTP